MAARTLHVLAHRNRCADVAAFAVDCSAMVVVHGPIRALTAQMNCSGTEVSELFLQMVGQPFVHRLTAHGDEG